MEAVNVILNFETKTASFFKEEVKMIGTRKIGTGHFCIDIVSENVETNINDIERRHRYVENAMVSTAKLNEKELKKLHHYYGHTPVEKLFNFLEKAGKETNN